MSEPGRFVTSPDGWHKHPDCDLHGVVDMLGAVIDGEGHVVEVNQRHNYLFSVTLDAGLGTDPNRFPEIITNRRRVQDAVELLCQRAEKGVQP